METLKKFSDFQRVNRRGKRTGDRCFSVCVLENRLGVSRLMCRVGKKSGHAVRRNAMKRRAKEIFRILLPSLKGSYDVVITLKEDILLLPFHRASEQLRELIGKLGCEFS